MLPDEVQHDPETPRCSACSTADTKNSLRSNLPGVQPTKSELRRDRMAQRGSASIEHLQSMLDAFNAHDLEKIMSHFAEDCTLQMPRGDRPWGGRFVGKSAVRDALASRLSGIPNVHYGDATHLVCGEVGISKWTISGTTTGGVPVEALGCDFYTFRDGKIVEKDSYWKIVEPKI
jgi:ketosteroid isomerase-like protein